MKIRGIYIILTYISLVMVITAFSFAFKPFESQQILGVVTFISNDNHPIKNGSIVFSKRTNNPILIGEQVYYFNSIAGSTEVLSSKVIDKNIVSEQETTYKLENGFFLSKSHLISNEDDVFAVPYVGFFLKTLFSSLGIIVIILSPIIIFSVYTVKNIAPTNLKGDKYD